MNATAADFKTLIEYLAQNQGVGYTLFYGANLYRSIMRLHSSKQMVTNELNDYDFDFGIFNGFAHYQRPLILRGQRFDADFYGAIPQTQPDDPTRQVLFTLDLGDTMTVSLNVHGGIADGTPLTKPHVALLPGGGSTQIDLEFVDGVFIYTMTIYVRLEPRVPIPPRITP